MTSPASTLAPAPSKGEDARRVVQLLGSAAELIVPDKDPAEMDRLERVQWSIRRTTLVMSLVDHLLAALNEWEPPEGAHETERTTQAPHAA